MGYFNIRDERRNPFLTFVSIIRVPHNGFKVSCLISHWVKSKFKHNEQRQSAYVCMWIVLSLHVSDVPADVMAGHEQESISPVFQPMISD